MIRLKHIEYADAAALDGSGYGTMSTDEREKMISESLQKSHNGHYWELFVVSDDDTVVGFMSAYAHSEHIVGIGPEIKPEFRGRGYAYEAENTLLQMMKEKGYTIATGAVRENNAASHALHKKLGFEIDGTYISSRGSKISLYIKAL